MDDRTEPAIAPYSGDDGADEALPPGTVLAGRYVIEEPIGAGGFGAVYRARQLPLERHVAVKVLPSKAMLDPARIARFEHEAALFQRLEHPNTVKLIDFGTGGGVPFIVMELLRGESLASLIEREGPQSEARTARVATDVLKALMEAHAIGIVHRDIKPANIFITRPAGDPFFVKLLDFGIAKETTADPVASTRRPTEVGAASSPALTGAGQTMGTPRYMAPEQVFAEAVGPASDIYSLGLTLAEMLEGAPVFASENVSEILADHASTTPTELPPRAMRSRFRDVLSRAIAKAPLDRYASAEEMFAAVEALEIDASRAATAGDSSTRIMVDRSAPVGAFDPTTATPLISQRSPRAPASNVGSLAIVAGPLALLAIGGIVLAFSKTSSFSRANASATSASASPPDPYASETPESLPRSGSILASDENELVEAIKPLGFHVAKWGKTRIQDVAVNVNVESSDCAGGILFVSAADEEAVNKAVAGYASVPPRYPIIRDPVHHRAIWISVAGANFAGERCTVRLYHALVKPD
jgi:serine/threonine protein kinase